MKKYLIIYTWYEFNPIGIIEAENEDEATMIFAKYVQKLNCNYSLEQKYGYASTLSPFSYDDESEDSFETQFKNFLENKHCGTLTIIEINKKTKGIITSKGFYNGEDE